MANCETTRSTDILENQILKVIPKAELSSEQAHHIAARLVAREHQNDKGPPQVWDAYDNGTLYAFVETTQSMPIGIAEASGPLNAVNAGWWVDKEYRGQGYGGALVDALVVYLKARGYSGVGGIRIDTYLGEYDQASTALRERFRANFDP